MDELEDACKNAIAKWGRDKQLDMAIEELAELTKAIVKYRRHDWNAVWRIKVLEEVADVEIMCHQVLILLAQNGDVDSGAEYSRIMHNKVENLRNIIKDDSPLRGIAIKK
jgi:hypothetical protein